MKYRLFTGFIFAIAFFCTGALTAEAATTVTCYKSCSSTYTNHVGDVILDLRCDSTSPSSYTGTIKVNGTTLSLTKSCTGYAQPVATITKPANNATFYTNQNIDFQASLSAPGSSTIYSDGGRWYEDECEWTTPIVSSSYSFTKSYNTTGPKTLYFRGLAGGYPAGIGNSIGNWWSECDSVTINITSAPTCTGSIPAGGTPCANDTTGLTTSLAWAQVGACTTTRKCEYTAPVSSPTLSLTANSVPGSITINEGENPFIEWISQNTTYCHNWVYNETGEISNGSVDLNYSGYETAEIPWREWAVQCWGPGGGTPVETVRVYVTSTCTDPPFCINNGPQQTVSCTGLETSCGTCSNKAECQTKNRIIQPRTCSHCPGDSCSSSCDPIVIDDSTCSCDDGSQGVNNWIEVPSGN